MGNRLLFKHKKHLFIVLFAFAVLLLCNFGSIMAACNNPVNVYTDAELRNKVKDTSVSCVQVMNDIQLTAVVWPNHNMTIYGNKNGTGEKVTLTAAPGTRILQLWVGRVEVENIIFQGGVAPATSDLGGAHYARTNSGGAIHMECCDGKSILVLQNSVFRNNSASVNGGAIAAEGGTRGDGCSIYAYNTVFESNSAGGHGGAIFLTGYFDSKMMIEDSYFTGNIASKNGGAIYSEPGVWSWGGYIVSIGIDRTSFINNTSQNGSAIYKPIIKRNDDNANAGELQDFWLRNSTFAGNTASGGSGAVYWGTSYDRKNGAIGDIIEHNTIVYNSGTTGGGLFLYGPVKIFRNNLMVGNTSATGPDFLLKNYGMDRFNAVYGWDEDGYWVIVGYDAWRSNTTINSGGNNIVGVSDLDHILITDNNDSVLPVMNFADSDIRGTTAAPLNAADYVSEQKTQTDGLKKKYYDPKGTAKDYIASCTLDLDMLRTSRPKNGKCDVGAIEVSITYINITVQNVWNDENNKWSLRPTSVTLTLQANGVDKQTVTLTGSGNTWSQQVANVPETDDNGNLITYTVKKPTVSAYNSSVSGLTATNSVITKSYPIVKRWNDGGNQDGIRPTSIKFNVLNGSTVMPGSPFTITQSGNWSLNVTMPQYDQNGREISYSVKEVK